MLLLQIRCGAGRMLCGGCRRVSRFDSPHCDTLNLETDALARLGVGNLALQAAWTTAAQQLQALWQLHPRMHARVLKSRRLRCSVLLTRF